MPGMIDWPGIGPEFHQRDIGEPKCTVKLIFRHQDKSNVGPIFSPFTKN